MDIDTYSLCVYEQVIGEQLLFCQAGLPAEINNVKTHHDLMILHRIFVKLIHLDLFSENIDSQTCTKIECLWKTSNSLVAQTTG